MMASLAPLLLISCVMQVFGRGAKFSMFKPAEEMVYIGLDSESRTKGKAAIDVVGAQTGKSLGAIVQQVPVPAALSVLSVAASCTWPHLWLPAAICFSAVFDALCTRHMRPHRHCLS